jgi:four helix bundle protein
LLILGGMSEADDLQRRVEQFADEAIRFIQGLSKTQIAQRTANQLQDSSTSTAANYRAARRGRSKAEFTAKIGLVSEEADESVFWLERLVKANIRSEVPNEPLLDEATQLVKIFGASYRTAKRRRGHRDDERGASRRCPNGQMPDEPNDRINK